MPRIANPEVYLLYLISRQYYYTHLQQYYEPVFFFFFLDKQHNVYGLDRTADGHGVNLLHGCKAWLCIRLVSSHFEHYLFSTCLFVLLGCTLCLSEMTTLCMLQQIRRCALLQCNSETFINGHTTRCVFDGDKLYSGTSCIQQLLQKCFKCEIKKKKVDLILWSVVPPASTP